MEGIRLNISEIGLHGDTIGGLLSRNHPTFIQHTAVQAQVFYKFNF